MPGRASFRHSSPGWALSVLNVLTCSPYAFLFSAQRGERDRASVASDDVQPAPALSPSARLRTRGPLSSVAVFLLTTPFRLRSRSPPSLLSALFERPLRAFRPAAHRTCLPTLLHAHLSESTLIAHATLGMRPSSIPCRVGTLFRLRRFPSFCFCSVGTAVLTPHEPNSLPPSRGRGSASGLHKTWRPSCRPWSTLFVSFSCMRVECSHVEDTEKHERCRRPIEQFCCFLDLR